MLLGGKRFELTAFDVITIVSPISTTHTCVATRPRIMSRTRKRAWRTAPSTRLVIVELLRRGTLVASPAWGGISKLVPFTTSGRSSFHATIAPAFDAVGVVAPIAASAVSWGAISSGGGLGIGRNLSRKGRRMLLTIVIFRFAPSRLIFGLPPSTRVLIVICTPSIITSSFRSVSRLVRICQVANRTETASRLTSIEPVLNKTSDVGLYLPFQFFWLPCF